MSLKVRINEDMKAAMRARDSERLGTIRLLQAALKQKEVDERIELDDTAIIAVIDKMLKQRKDSIEQYEAALAAGKGSGWYDDALYRLACLICDFGLAELDAQGRWTTRFDYPRALDEALEFVDDRGEERLVGEKPGREPMHAKRALGHVALGIDVAMEMVARRQVVEQLDARHLDDAVALVAQGGSARFGPLRAWPLRRCMG